MTYGLVRFALASKIPYADVLAMPPELLATFMLAHHDLHRGADDDELDDGSLDELDAREDDD